MQYFFKQIYFSHLSNSACRTKSKHSSLDYSTFGDFDAFGFGNDILQSQIKETQLLHRRSTVSTDGSADNEENIVLSEKLASTENNDNHAYDLLSQSKHPVISSPLPPLGFQHWLARTRQFYHCKDL